MPRVRLFSGLALLATATTFGTADARAQAGRRYRDPGARSHFDTTFAFNKNGSISVRASRGDIAVTGWSRNAIHVRAVSGDDNLRFSASSSQLTLEEGDDHRGSDTRFEVSVPHGVHVLASGQSGGISVRGTRGQVEAHSLSGDIDIENATVRLDVNTLSGAITASNISGDAKITTISGDVKLLDVRGSVDVGTVSGDVGLRGITAKFVRTRTTSGDIMYDGVIDPTGRYEFGAHSGDIGVHLRPNASAQLTVSTWSGGINSDFPMTLKPGEQGIGRSTSKRVTFEIGSGAARITAETFSGDITISSDGHGPREPQ